MAISRTALPTRLLCILLLLGGYVRADSRPLEQLLSALAEQQGFSVKGLSLTRDRQAAPAAGSPGEQLEQLLTDFNYLVALDEAGNIRQLTLLGEKPVNAGQMTLPTRRRGNQHSIPVSLSRDGLDWLDLTLLIDTGANMLVLEERMLEQLGIAPEELEQQQVQTANGRISARIGTIGLLRLGHEELYDVEAAFLPTEQLGGQQLLGMNVLGQFRMTIDDQKNQVTLTRTR